MAKKDEGDLINRIMSLNTRTNFKSKAWTRAETSEDGEGSGLVGSSGKYVAPVRRNMTDGKIGACLSPLTPPREKRCCFMYRSSCFPLLDTCLHALSLTCLVFRVDGRMNGWMGVQQQRTSTRSE